MKFDKTYCIIETYATVQWLTLLKTAMSSNSEVNGGLRILDLSWVYKHEGRHEPWLLLILTFVGWAVIATCLSYHHVFWRDEVRALSFALQGENVISMLKSLHGEGHPAVWYLLLRGMYWIVDAPYALNYTAILVAAAATALLITRSPFRLYIIALFLFGGIAAFEYAGMTRNYGISMLFLFLFATLYPSKRENGYLLGITLFFLANCNAHSALIVAVLLMFWFADIAIQKKSLLRPLTKNFIINALIAGVGITGCFLTILPTFNDAAVVNTSGKLSVFSFLNSVLNPAERFGSLLRINDAHNLLSRINILDSLPSWVISALYSTILFASTLGLVRRPAAFLAALATLIGFSIFFTFVYPGGYRHQALWLVLLVTMYWITGGHSFNQSHKNIQVEKNLFLYSRIGLTCFCILLLIQIPNTIRELARTAGYGDPLSQSASVKKIIDANPRLKSAVIIADPDYLLEALPYYIDNRTYLVREARFGNIVRFTKNAKLRIDLDDLLGNALNIKKASGRPVLILMAHPLDHITSDIIIKEGYNWEFRTNISQTKKFLESVQLISKASPTYGDEKYDIYLLD